MISNICSALTVQFVDLMKVQEDTGELLLTENTLHLLEEHLI